VAEALAEAAAGGYRTYIVTSKPRPFAERIAAALGLDAHLAGVYGAELDGRFDDKAELLRHVLEAEGLARAPGVMIGDRHQDVRAARAVGVRALGVTWGFGTAEELRAAGADALCASPPDLLRVARGLLE
jgi:phosphoglycolate phosphatase